MTGDIGTSGCEAVDAAASRPSITASSAWAMGGYAAGQLLRFAGNLVLTRLLFPEVFGVMALITTLMQGLVMFSDVGIGPAIIQRPGGASERFLRTAWTVQCLRGVLLWLVACALARPFAAFYGEPRLAAYVPVAGFTAVLLGFEATSAAALSRDLRLRRITIVDLAAQALGLAVMIALAAAHRSLLGPDPGSAVWAVVAGTLVGTVARVVLSHAALPGIRHRFELGREELAVLFGFGRWIFVSTLLTFLVGQSDRLVFGKMIPLDLLGVYGVASALAMLPAQASQRLGSAVLFPAYSRLQDSPRFDSVFHRVRLPLALGGAAAASALVACGPSLIDLLYDARYAAAGWIVQLLAVAGWFQILESTNSAAILAQGRLRWLTANRAAKLASLLVLLPLGFRLGGFRGALVGLVVSDAVKYAISTAGLRCGRWRAVATDAALSAAAAAAALVAGLAAHHVRGEGGGPGAVFVAGASVVALTWVPAAIWYARRAVAARRRATAPREGLHAAS
jgi:O-antigen/teichoic acid export membrane protein